MAEPSVSVLVLNYNGKKFLDECIDSVLQQKYGNLEVILIDNNSVDDSVAYATQRWKGEIRSKRVRILPLKKNYGFARGNNEGYYVAKGKYVLILNNDTKLIDKEMIRKSVRHAEKIGAAIVGIMDFPFGTKLKSPNVKADSISLIATNVPEILDYDNLLYTSGCCFLVKKKLFSKLFDDDYFMYGEDAYLGWIANLRGLKVSKAPNTILWHHGSGTSGKDSPFVRYYGERNRFVNTLIFHERKTLLKILPLFVLDYFLRLVIFLLAKPKFFVPYLRATWWVLTHLGLIMKKRKYVQGVRNVPDEKVLPLMSHKLLGMKRSGKLQWFYRILDFFTLNYCKLVRLNVRELQ